MECPRIRRLVEVEVATENLVGTFTAQYHFDAHTLDDTSQQIHRGGGSYSGYIVCLDKVYHVADSIQTFLYRIVNLMVYRTDEVGHFASLNQVGRPFQPDSKGVKLRPPSLFLSVRLDTPGCKLLCNGRNHRTIQATGKQDTVRNIAHQLAAHGIFEGVVQGGDRNGIGLSTFVSHPIPFVPAYHFTLAARIVMPRQKGFVTFAETLESLQFASTINRSVGIVPYI